MKTSNRKKSIMRKVAILMLAILALAFVFSFGGPQKWLSDKLGWTAEKTKSVVRTVVLVSLGAFLISSGVAALAIPVLGGAMIVIGLILVGVALYPWFKKPTNEVEPE